MRASAFTLFFIIFFTSGSVVSQLNTNSTTLGPATNVESLPQTALNVRHNVENKAEKKTAATSPIYSEGDIISARVLPTKPGDNKLVNSTNDLQNRILSLDTKVFGSETSVKSTVHGRKGVKLPEVNSSDSEKIGMNNKDTGSALLDLKHDIKTVVSPPPKSVSSTEKLKNIVIETPKPLPKKPTKTISSDDADDEGELKKSGLPIMSSMTAASGRPDLVVPFVITAFSLPLFAILGYYALKHGREAWKNRHYRRMDFLLDGMYND